MAASDTSQVYPIPKTMCSSHLIKFPPYVEYPYGSKSFIYVILIFTRAAERWTLLFPFYRSRKSDLQKLSHFLTVAWMGFTLKLNGRILALPPYAKLLPSFLKSSASDCHYLPTAHLFSVLQDSVLFNWHVLTDPHNTGSDFCDYFLSFPKDGL